MDYREPRYERDYDYDDMDYREDYRTDYRDGRRGRRRNYRTEEEYMEELSECIKNGVCAAKMYDKLAEMTDDREDKNNLMKMAQREREHYSTTRKMLEKHM